MSADNFEPDSVQEIVRDKAWSFMGEIRSKATPHDPVFKQEGQLYYLETCVWNLVTLISATIYHAKRVFAEIDQALSHLGSPEAIEQLRRQENDMMGALWEKFEKKGILVSPTHDPPKALSRKERISVSSGPILFEFNAFLVSARSALDYAARILGIYIKGTNFRSIHKLYKSLKKNHPEADLTQFLSREWKCWIELLKSYRDAVTHNIVLDFTASREVSVEHISTPNGVIEHPISDDLLGFYIYRTPPKFRYRVIGMEDVFDQDLPIMEAGISVTVRLPDGTKTVIRRSAKRIDATTVMPLEQYLAETLKNMQRFVIEIFALLEAQRGQFFVSKAHGSRSATPPPSPHTCTSPPPWCSEPGRRRLGPPHPLCRHL